MMTVHHLFGFAQGVQGSLRIAPGLENTHQGQIADHPVAAQSSPDFHSGSCMLVGCIQLIPLAQQTGQAELVGTPLPRFQPVELHQPLV